MKITNSHINKVGSLDVNVFKDLSSVAQVFGGTTIPRTGIIKDNIPHANDIAPEINAVFKKLINHVLTKGDDNLFLNVSERDAKTRPLIAGHVRNSKIILTELLWDKVSIDDGHRGRDI